MKKSRIIIVVVLPALVVLGSMAKNTLAEHRYQNFSKVSLKDSIQLVEEYDEVTHWDPTMEPVKKIVYVKNERNNGIGQYTLNDAFVRLQIKEFLAEAEVDYIYSEDRFLIDTNGNFIRCETKEEALRIGKEYNKDLSETDIIQKTSAFDNLSLEKKGGYWYIKTQNIKSNGVYGKFLVEDVVIDAEGFKSLANDEHAEENNKDNIQIKKSNLTENEHFTIQSWKDYESGQYSVFRNYVKLNLGKNVISLNSWREQGAGLVDKWILDTDNDEGWAYWGNPLLNPNENSMISYNKTDNFLESVQLLKYPKGKIKYSLDVQLDAVNYEDLVNWDSAPSDLMKFFTNYYDNNLDYTDLQLSYNLAIEKSKRLTRIERYNRDSLNNFNKALKNAGMILSELNADNQNVINMARNTLDKAIENLKLNITFEGNFEVGTRIIDFAGKKWTVLHKDNEGKALIISDVMSEEELMNIDLISPNKDEVKFNNEGLYGNGYQDSNLKIINDDYYAKNIHGKKEESFIEPIVIGDEKPIAELDVSALLKRKDSPTVVDYESGIKQAFTLSISDWNSYSSLEKSKEIFGGIRMWTTTPGLVDELNRIRSIISVLFK